MAAVALEDYGPQATRQHVRTLQDIFAAVFGEPPYYEGPDDVASWLKDLDVQLTQPGFQLVLARVDERVVGFAYGYTMTPDMLRWQRIVEPHAGCIPIDAIQEGRIFTLMEFAVLGKWRHRGIGRALHDRLLISRTEHGALLTVRQDAEAAQAAYQSWGWVKVGHRPHQAHPGYDVLVRPLT